jgi:serine protease Do
MNRSGLMHRKQYFSAKHIILLMVTLSLMSYGASAASSDSLRRSPVVEAVEKVGPAVVNISTEKIIRERANPFYNFGMDPLFDEFFRDYFETYPTREYKQESLGSGVIIDKRGYILTNEHVILKASKIKVILADGREFDGKLIGSDSKSDIAVVSIQAKGEMPVVTMGDSTDLMIGETVIAIGNPFGLSHTVTTGVISALDRSIKASDKRVFSDFIQTDASINPGNSGGPLLNINGELIGINTAIYQKAQGIGFAIPINKAKHIVSELIQFGKVQNAWLGVFVQDLTPELARYFGLTSQEGVLVSQVVKNSPGDKSDLKPGDIILQVGGRNVKSAQEYKALIAGFTAHSEIKIRVSSNNQIRELAIIAAELPLESAQEVAYNWLGIGVGEISLNNALRRGSDVRKGVIVAKVVEGGPAFQIGIKPGDVIRQINNQSIADLNDFRQAIISAYPKESVLLLIQRGDYGYYVTIQP